MNEEQLIKAILNILPNAIFDEDADGEYIIMTGLTLEADGNLTEIEAR